MKSKFIIFFFSLIFLCDLHSTFSDEWKRIYLATYPRSGNIWALQLIEEVTHIATSSVFCTKNKKHFPWGACCWKPGFEGACRYPNLDDYVVIKTHYPAVGPKVRNDYEGVVRIIRNPIDSFYSFFALKGGSGNKVPSTLVNEYIKSWVRFQSYWNNKRDVTTVRYEDMLKDPEKELRTIIKAIKYEATDEDITRAVLKHPPIGCELKHKDKFFEADLEIIRHELKEFLEQFNYDI